MYNIEKEYKEYKNTFKDNNKQNFINYYLKHNMLFYGIKGYNNAEKQVIEFFK